MFQAYLARNIAYRCGHVCDVLELDDRTESYIRIHVTFYGALIVAALLLHRTTAIDLFD